MQPVIINLVVKSFLNSLEKIGFTPVPYAIGQNFLEGGIVASPVAQRRAEHSERSEDASKPFSKEILPKTLTPHFCTSLFLHNFKHDCSVTYCRAETYTESIEDATQSNHQKIGFIPSFLHKIDLKTIHTNYP
jgi:hypothetical protein